MNNSVVIMAGGKGKRLGIITKILPKPLIPIGDIPIAERIINKFLQFNYTHFYITINFKKNLIKTYFNNIEKNYNIQYVEEEKPLGTAGSLYMLKNKIKSPFFVSNCDILIDGNYNEMMKFHIKNKNKITIIAAAKHFTLPYGVLKLDSHGLIKEMTEKPQYNCLVNTGMYILEPEILENIPRNEFFDITDLIKLYIDNGEPIGVFPIKENAWLDMGQIEEMENMNNILNLQN